MDVTSVQPTPEQAVELKRNRAIEETALRSIFLEARTANGFLDAPVPRALLEQAVELAQLGPTSANGLPARFVFIESKAAKERLKPVLAPGNLDKTMAAPVTAIVAADLEFYENFPRTFPTRPEMRDRFAGPESKDVARTFARDNGLLEMAYFMIAARSLGLDVGAMGGFDKDKTDAEFFPDGKWISLYLVNVGYADDSKSFPRLPRLEPAEVSRYL